MLAVKAKALLSTGEYHIPALQGPAADVSTSHCGIPLPFFFFFAHIHTRSPLEVLSVKKLAILSRLSAFDCRFHGGLVKRGGFDTKKYNKQRKLETRQTFWVTSKHTEACQPAGLCVHRAG